MSPLFCRLRKIIARLERRDIVLEMDWYQWDFKLFLTRLSHHAKFNKKYCLMHIEKDDIISQQDLLWAKNYLAGQIRSVDNLMHAHYHGFNLWQIAKGDIIVNLNLAHEKQMNESHLEKATEILAEILCVMKCLPDFFKRVQPKAVIVYEGARAFSRAIVETARFCNVRAIALGTNSLRPGYLFFDNTTGMIINRHRLAKCGRELLETRVFTAEQRQKALDTWRSEISQKTDQHRTGGIDDHEKIRQKLCLPAEKPVALLLAHVRNDTSVVYDSPLYNDSVDFIADVIDFFAADLKDWILVVRLHPKEAGGFSPGGFKFNYETKQELERRGYASRENIRIVAEKVYNTYTLMDIARVGITEVSQAGLEMAMLGKPVVTVGEAFYGHKGFTWDISHPSAFKSVISDACISSMDTSLRSRIQEKALEFAYALFFEELVADDLSENFDKVLRTLEGC